MRGAAVAAVVAAALSLPGSALQAAGLPPSLAYERIGGGVFARMEVGRVTRTRLVTARGTAPAWSPDGRRLTYVAPSGNGQTDLFVVDADGRHGGQVTRTRRASEVAASWAPDGRRLVVERNLRLFVMGADGRGERLLAAGRAPAWAPRGGLIAFVSDRTGLDRVYVIDARGRGMRQVATLDGSASEPAWSPDGRRLAFVSLLQGSTDLYVLDVQTAELLRLTQDPALETSPVWSSTGAEVFFLSDRTAGGPLWSIPATGGVATSRGGPAALARIRIRPAVSLELPPDLDQRPPADLSVRRSGSRYLLGFTSASDNIGLGPLSIVASRRSVALPTMRASQQVRVFGGRGRTYPGVGFLRYTIAFPHRHWHLMDFQRYELRRASDHTLVVRDRKSGFCLADHWAQVPGAVPGKPRHPVFSSNCRQGDPNALSVSQGTSVGYTDRYPAYFHGQDLDVTRVPAGSYVLVHRSNAGLLLREARYENNAASVRVRLSWSRGPERRPSVRVLRICAGAEWCPS